MSCLEVVPLEQTTRLRQSGLTLRGSDVSAAGHATLLAEGDVTLQSQAQSVQQHSTERSSSAGVGLALTYGQGGWAAGFTANASAARGHADGQDLTHRHTEVNAGQGATLVSGRDTTLSGAQVSGEQLTARVGRDLTIQSVQDTATYDSQHRSAGGSITIGYGFAASASYSNARVEADHASVSQHSGLRAGDQGFQVEVKGHTELQGGLIASTQAAVDEGRNRLATGTLSTQDLTNRSEHDARGISLSGGFSYGGSGKQGSSEGAGTGSTGTGSPGTSAPAQPSSGVALQQFQTGSQGVAAGYVSDSSSRTSTTRSGISGGEVVISDAAAQQERTGQSIEETLASVNRDVLSSTEANGLTQRWDGQKLQKQVQAGAQIVATFGQQASKAVGDYATDKARELRQQGNEEEARKWDEGGAYRVAAHIAVGGLSGGLEGALGSGSSAAAAQALNEMTADLPQGVRQAVGAGIAAGLGALTGGPTGASTAFNADVNNRQLHPDEKTRIKQLAGGDAEKEARLTAAACAMVRCYAEYPVDSATYQYLKQLADIGASSAFASERHLLADQTGMFGYTTGGVFSDKNIDAAKQLNNTYQISTRTVGAGQAALGALGVAGSAATAPVSCATGIGCAANAVVGAISLDTAYAGARQVVTGNPEATYLNQGLQGLGLSPEAAAWTEAAFGLSAAVKAGAVANKAIDEAMAANKLGAASYQTFTTNGIKVTPEVMQTPQAQALVKEIQAGSPHLTGQEVKGIAAAYIESGAALPQVGIATPGSTLVKEGLHKWGPAVLGKCVSC